ncbi:MAG: AAA family ATPase [Richelia sp. RM2_1_2]|nr:AAA family ATPase [Richelia sp. RM2_1_2]
MLRYPIGIQDFEKLRKEGFVYIDKTQAIFELFKEVDIIFFHAHVGLVNHC